MSNVYQNVHIPLTEDEKSLMTHISRFGSDGYPVAKVGSHHWVWGPFRSIKGAPVVFPTKKQAVQSFENYMDSLRARLGEEARRRAVAAAQS